MLTTESQLEKKWDSMEVKTTYLPVAVDRIIK